MSDATSRAAATGGRKDDGGKAPWHLAPWDAFQAIVEVLAFGAHKYAERNWEQGIAYSRVFSAAQRHLTAWWSGEDLDPETGMSHLAHAACCVCFLLAFATRKIPNLDDRPGVPKPSQSDPGPVPLPRMTSGTPDDAVGCECATSGCGTEFREGSEYCRARRYENDFAFFYCSRECAAADGANIVVVPAS